MKIFGKHGLAPILAVLCAGAALAHPPHHHPSVRFGIYLGDPWFYPYPYPYWPRVYAPPVVVAPPPAPPVYVEQPPVVQTLEPGYWYYCNEARAYYPDVKECPGPWRKVAPQPSR